MGSAKNTLRDIYYISALLSSFCVLCFLASPPSKKPEQAITHPETFLKLSIGCLRYCSLDFTLILSCLVQEKHFLISKYNRFTSLPRVRSTFPLSHRKRFMSLALSPPPHGWHAFRAFWPLCVLFPLPGLFQPWQTPFLTSNPAHFTFSVEFPLTPLDQREGFPLSHSWCFECFSWSQ